MAEFMPMVEFSNGTRDFCLGFEAGNLWARLEHCAETGEPFSQTIHDQNAEVTIRMCEYLGVSFRAEDLEGYWIEAFFGEGDGSA